MDMAGGDRDESPNVSEPELDYEQLEREYAEDEFLPQGLIESEEQEPEETYYDQVDLSNLRLTKLTDEHLQELGPETRYLELYENYLSELPSQIAEFVDLVAIDLSRNEFDQIPTAVFNLTNLEAFLFSGNSIKSFPGRLAEMPALRIIDCSNNSIDRIDKSIQRLHILVNLDVSNNQLNELPEEVGRLEKLERLLAAGNSIRRLPVSIGDLKALRVLELSGNRIRSIPPVVQWLTSLERLGLSHNELTGLPSQIGKLENLQELLLEGNNIRTVPKQIGKLSNLQMLDLRDNQISTLPLEFGYLPESIQLRLEGNPLEEPLPTLLQRGTPSLLTYLRSLGDGTPQYEAKLLLVGEGGVGKSSLIGALRGEDFVVGRETTHGIELCELALPHPLVSRHMKLNSWDFGGQEVYRITHQFFFTKRALYLVVWKPREGQEENNVEYWCRRIRLRVGDHARIIVVATHTSERRPEFDFELLQAKFPKLVVDYVEVDSESGRGIDNLKDKIATHASHLPQMGEILSGTWAAARDEILAEEGSHISRSRFERICDRHGLDEESAETLGDLQHDLGHIIHYADDEGLKDIIVLQPEWLTKAIGYVLEDKVTRDRGGVLEHRRLNDIWATSDGEQLYDRGLYRYFLRLMEKFDVSYRLPDTDSSLVAQLVPYRRPTTVWQDRASVGANRRVLRTVCKLDDEAPGIIAWLTVRNHRFSTGQHWRYGVLLKHEEYGAQGLFEISENRRDVVLTVIGPSPDYFFHVLRDSLEDLISKRWRGLGYRFYVPCSYRLIEPVFCRGSISLRSLQRFRERGEVRIVCDECANWNDVTELLTGFGKVVAPIDGLLEGMQELQRKTLASIWDIQAKSSEIARYTRNTLKILSTEVDDCPRLFSIVPRDRNALASAVSTKIPLVLTLWCEEAGMEHPCDGAGYEFQPSREWLARAAPYLRTMCKLLKFAVPVGASVYAAAAAEESLKGVQGELDLMKTLVDKMPAEIAVTSTSLTPGMSRAEGEGLRAMRVLLGQLDPSAGYGGLRRVITPAGDILWICKEHHRNYDPGLPTV